MKEFTGTFEVFDVIARRLRNGNKLRMVLEAPYDKDAEKDLVDLRFKMVAVHLIEQDEPQLEFDDEEDQE